MPQDTAEGPPVSSPFFAVPSHARVPDMRRTKPSARTEKMHEGGPVPEASPRPRTVIAEPSEVALDLIDQDPQQPRSESNPGFSASSLAELAASIRLRQVRTPISLRDDPMSPGRFIINHGARRFRASRLAGKTTIPAFIDNGYNEVDQVVENLQRNELTAREIADYIGRELAKGMKKGQIATAISKSPAYVTQHAALLDLPEPIATAFAAGRVKDVTVINELVTIHKKWPRDVVTWLARESQEVTRSSIKFLRAFLEEKRREEPAAHVCVGREVGSAPSEPGCGALSGETAALVRIKRPAVHVRHAGRIATLMLYRLPSRTGSAWLSYLDDGQEAEVALDEVELEALLEA
jgi:ParB family chromosome partitioning protein